MYDYIVYTDGGYLISSDVGAGAYVILKSDAQEPMAQKSFVVRKESSQRAELEAIIAAVSVLPYGCKAQVYTDNQYAAQALGKTPRRKTKPDADLLILYRQVVRQRKLKIELQWVRSHKGHKWNEFCDNLCTEALSLADRPLPEPSL